MGEKNPGPDGEAKGPAVGRLLLVSLLLLPLIEIAGFVVIGRAIGLLPTLLGVFVAAVAGVLLLRFQGMALWAQMRASMGRGALPARALADAMMVAFAGVLLLTPGYFTDLLGLPLLIPPVRGLLYAALARRVHVVAAAPAGYGPGPERRLEDDGPIELDAEHWRHR